MNRYTAIPRASLAGGASSLALVTASQDILLQISGSSALSVDLSSDGASWTGGVGGNPGHAGLVFRVPQGWQVRVTNRDGVNAQAYSGVYWPAGAPNA